MYYSDMVFDLPTCCTYTSEFWGVIITDKFWTKTHPFCVGVYGFQLDNAPPNVQAFSLNTTPLQLLLWVNFLTSSSLVSHFPVHFHFLTTKVQILVVTMQVGINTVSVTYGMF